MQDKVAERKFASLPSVPTRDKRTRLMSCMQRVQCSLMRELEETVLGTELRESSSIFSRNVRVLLIAASMFPLYFKLISQPPLDRHASAESAKRNAENKDNSFQLSLDEHKSVEISFIDDGFTMRVDNRLYALEEITMPNESTVCIETIRRILGNGAMQVMKIDDAVQFQLEKNSVAIPLSVVRKIILSLPEYTSKVSFSVQDIEFETVVENPLLQLFIDKTGTVSIRMIEVQNPKTLLAKK